MESALFQFLVRVGLNDDDIDFICNSFPELDNIDSEDAIENARLVVDYGFPIDELEWLILINPSFLINSPMLLEEILQKLGNNVESELKKNPFII